MRWRRRSGSKTMTEEDRTAITDICLLAHREDLLSFYLQGGFTPQKVMESLLALEKDLAPLGRKEILAGAGVEDTKRKVTLVRIPELGGKVWIRELNPVEKVALKAFAADGSDLAVYKTGFVLWSTVVDGNGHQVLSEPDVMRIGQGFSREDLREVFRKIRGPALGQE